MTLWYNYKSDDPGEADEIRAHVRVPADSPWFDGHFPDAPLLPGVAQLAMAHDMLVGILKEHRPVKQVSRVRFKRMIRPEQPLSLRIKPSGDGSDYGFRIICDEGVVCSGRIQLGEKGTA